MRLALTAFFGLWTATGCIWADVDHARHWPTRPSGDVEVAPARSEVALLWSFPWSDAGRRGCQAMGVDWVRISLNRSEWVTAGCADGLEGSLGVELAGWVGEEFLVELEGLDGSGYPLFRGAASVRVTSARFSPAVIPLSWSVGGVEIQWALWAGGRWVGCEQLGIRSVGVHFIDDFGREPYGPWGDTQPCNAQSVAYEFLPEGRYQVSLVAEDDWGRVFRSRLGAGNGVVIRGGIFSRDNIPLALALEGI